MATTIELMLIMLTANGDDRIGDGELMDPGIPGQ